MQQVASLGASDLHLKSGATPYLRLNGELRAVPGARAASIDDVDAMVRELTRRVPNRLHEFEQTGEADLSYELPGCCRFRVSVYRQRGEISAALRVVPESVPTLNELNLPPVLERLALEPRGLVLVTGATGSGKSTTLSAMIDHVNEHRAKHIVTIEDPIEMVHHDKRSLVNQREVGLDTGSFSGALRRALRQDPDIIMIGEMRDEETVRAALSAAETGHLVFSTLHTIDVMETIHRVLDFFPAALERQARAMLAGTLRGVVSQRLARTVDGRSRVPAVEVMVGTSRICDAIANADETGAINDAIAEGSYYGMQTFDQALLQLVVDGAVAVEEAINLSTSQQNFALMLEAADVRIERVVRRQAAGSQNVDDVRDSRTPQRPQRPMPAQPAAAITASGLSASSSERYLPAMSGSTTGAAAAAAGGPATGFAPATGAARPGDSRYAGIAPYGARPGANPATAGTPATAPATPAQPRPQPGISPERPGHSAA